VLWTSHAQPYKYWLQSCLAPELSVRCQQRMTWTLQRQSCRSVTVWSCLVSHWTHGLTMDWHITGVQLPHAYTASHPPSANTRHCQDNHPQCCLIAAGLLQYTTARHVCHQHQQAASGTEHTGQGDVFCQRHKVMQTTTLVANPPTNNRQYKREPPAVMLTSLTWFTTTSQNRHYDPLINCYCLYRG